MLNGQKEKNSCDRGHHVASPCSDKTSLNPDQSEVCIAPGAAKIRGNNCESGRYLVISVSLNCTNICHTGKFTISDKSEGNQL